MIVSAPVPWIGDLGTRDWGLGLDNCMKNESYASGPANDATPYSNKDLGPSFVKQYVLSEWFIGPSKMKVGNTRTMEMVLVLNRKFNKVIHSM